MSGDVGLHLQSEKALGRQRAFRFEQAGCIACRACQMACKDLNNLPVGVNWRRVTTTESGVYPRPVVSFLSISCEHCQEPACVPACPEDALTKRPEDGLVLLDAGRCTGCQSCVEACQFGALQFDPARGQVSKCDFCEELVAQGEPPACVSACVMRVLHAGWIDLRGEWLGDG